MRRSDTAPIITGALILLLLLGAVYILALNRPNTTSMENQLGVGGPMMAQNVNAEAVIADWPPNPQEAARELINKYGQPDEITPSHIIWYDNGPWKRTIVYRDEIPHMFPSSHTDFVEQTIDYQVPPEMFDELAMYDSSVIAERTAGTLSARCDTEAFNFLALNLANDVVNGKPVDQARQEYVDIVNAYMRGENPEYTQGLRFNVAEGGTADLDRPL